MSEAQNRRQLSRILVVDDNPNLLRTLTALLSQEGFDVVACATSAQAFSHLEQQEFGLAVIDLRLPDQSGTQLLERLYAIRESLPVIVYTGHGDYESAKDAINLGVAAYLEKAGNPGELLTCVHKTLQKNLDRYADTLETLVAQRTAVLSDREERARRYFELGLIGMATIGADERWREVNDQLCTILGYTREELLHMTWRESVHPDNQTLVETPLSIFAEKHPTGMSLDVCFIRKDHAMVSTSMGLNPLTHPDGSLDYCVAMIQNISKRKRAEERTREKEAQLRALVDSTTDAIITIDQEAKIQFWNQAAQVIFGYHAQEVLGQPHTLLMPESFREECLERVKQAMAAKRLLSIHNTADVTALRKDGTEFPARVSLSIWESDNGMYCTSIVRDITTKIQLEQQLRQSQKMEALGTMAGGIAHDFNNILMTMLGNTELALLNTPKGEKKWNQLRQVQNAGYRAKDLVRQILTFTRQSVFERKPLQLKVIIEETIQFLRATLPSTIEIRQSLHTDRTILADATQMHQVLMNLCANAEYAMRATGGVLGIRLEETDVSEAFASQYTDLSPGPHIRLTIKDTGQGIPPDVLERIFDPFFTTKPVGEGTGMGLSVIRGIVLHHGGIIMVQSEQGKGTTFDIYFPLIQQAQAQTSIADDHEIPRGHERILFIDDEQTLTELGHECLTQLGYEVVAIFNSSEAIPIFRETPQAFDLVITDQTMPHLTGIHLVQQLRDIRDDIPIILCTGGSHLVTPDQINALGIQAFLRKPFSVHDLGITVREVLDRRK